MKIFKLRFFSFAILMVILVVGCKKEEFNAEDAGTTPFKSEKYGFSFSYPQKWEEISKDLPDRWALLDKNKNPILFLVSRAQSKDLIVLGRSQALRDLYPNNTISDLKQDKLKEVIEIVKLESFGNQTWYTYGIRFPGKNVNSLVSGTLCGDNEIVLVLVSDPLYFDENQGVYKRMLSTFEC